MRPKHVHPKNGRWYYVKNNKWTPLSRIDEGDAALYAALAKAINPLPDRLGMVFQHFLADADLEIGDVTRKEYARVMSGILTHHFGHMRPDDLTPSDVAQYLQMRQKAGAKVAGNREKAALSSAFEYAMRNGWAKANPCRGVRRNKERPSRVNVKTDELIATHDRASPALQLLLNGLYLSGMRLGEICNLRRDQLLPDHSGFVIVESKTKHEHEKTFKPGMREVVRRAIEFGDAIATKITKKLPKARPLPEYVFVNMRGKKWGQWAVSSAMDRAGATFAPRQLRSKAQTDSKDNILGHEGQMRRRYTRRLKTTTVA